MGNVLQHLQQDHPADDVKIRQHVLDPSSGTFSLQTKGYGISGNQCTEQGCTISFDAGSCTVVLNTKAEVLNDSPLLKRRKEEDFPQAAAMDDINFEKENSFMNDILPAALETVKGSGFQYEYDYLLAIIDHNTIDYLTALT